MKKPAVLICIFLLVVLLGAIAYTPLWFFFSKYLMNFIESNLSGILSFENIRGACSFASAVVATSILFIPVIALKASTHILIPSLFAIFSFSHVYVVRTVQDENMSIVLSIYWIFDNLQSFLVFLSFVSSPFITYYIGYILFNKAIKFAPLVQDAAKLRLL